MGATTAEAEPPLAVVAGPGEAETDVASGAAAYVGPGLQSSQRHRRGGSHRHHEQAAGLVEVGGDQLRRPRSGRRRGGEERGCRQGERAGDLAGGDDGGSVEQGTEGFDVKADRSPRSAPAETVFCADMSPRITQRRRRAALVLALAALALGAAPASAAQTGGAGQVEGPVQETPIGNTPFDRQGMWIWYVSRSERGDPATIIARARRAGIGTVYVKGADGADVWRQFSRPLVRRLHRAGIDVCAWQFVYGRRPLAEARAAARAVRRGADCFVIDAEADYEGRYAAADRYVRALRARIGDGFPVSLAGFPYVDYHPSFPYSVFLGPEGADFNQPQMYWKTIGTSVRAVFEHTYLHNRIYGAPIYPLGQTYEAPGNRSLRLFRRYAASHGGFAVSWWSWQETRGREWGALAARVGERPLTRYRVEVEHPLLKRGSRGDMVVWAQQHLVAAGERLPITGFFRKRTRAAVLRFQRAHDLPATGTIGTETWEALISYEPVRARWAARPARHGARARPASRPLSASLPAKAYEIDPGP